MRLSPLVLSLLALASAALGAGCSTEDSSSTGYTVTVTTTAISIDPKDILGDVPCSSAEGALRSYVVTVFDHTDPAHIATLPSGPPTPCSQGVAFRYILPGRVYTAEIDGYEALAEDILPAGGIASGSRHMTLTGSGEAVTPRWTSSCGTVMAAVQTNVGFKNCSELLDHGSSTTTGIRIDPRSALGELQCVGAGGNVASFDILPEGGNLPAVTGIPCGSAPITYSAGITPGEPYAFRVEAHAEALGPVVWATSCSVLPKDGLIELAACDFLASSGAIDVPIDELLAANSLKCGSGTDVATYIADIKELELTTGPVPCDKPARITPLAAGPYSLTVRAYDGDGAMALEATCAATVAPGDAAKPTCQ